MWLIKRAVIDLDPLHKEPLAKKMVQWQVGYYMPGGDWFAPFAFRDCEIALQTISYFNGGDSIIAAYIVANNLV